MSSLRVRSIRTGDPSATRHGTGRRDVEDAVPYVSCCRLPVPYCHITFHFPLSTVHSLLASHSSLLTPRSSLLTPRTAPQRRRTSKACPYTFRCQLIPAPTKIMALNGNECHDFFAFSGLDASFLREIHINKGGRCAVSEFKKYLQSRY